MDLVVGTLLLRPYVFAFLAAYLVSAVRDLGWRRTLGFTAAVWPTAWLAEFSSTRWGVPFGLYHYTGETRGRELFIADVPFMDSLSFTFLAYASFCLARAALRGRRPAPTAVAGLGGLLMMLLDVVIDPLAVRGDRWFLGRVFYYAQPGVYFGVPLSNFAGWWVVGAAGLALYLHAGGHRASATAPEGEETPAGAWLDPSHGGRVGPGVGLYYAVLGFNLAVTAWIGEWLLLGVGVVLHALVALAVLASRPASHGAAVETRGVLRA